MAVLRNLLRPLYRDASDDKRPGPRARVAENIENIDGGPRSRAQVAQIFGRVNTLSGSVRTESVSAEFSTVASEP